MRTVELFAGVGGFRVGLERAGHAVVWANEWDKYACATYDKNFGGAIDRRDITTIHPPELPEHELIVGGFPCQAFSIAGKRRGFDETRGTLFFDILRIASHHRTPYLLLENVKGLLSHDHGRTFQVILWALDDAGYEVQWQVCNSKNFGVPQNRERLIVVANLRDRARPEVFPLTGAELKDHQPGDDEQPRAQRFIKTRYLGQNGSLISDATTLQASELPHIITGSPMVLVPEATRQGYAIAEVGDSINLQQLNSTTRRGRIGRGLGNTVDTSMFQHTIDPDTWRIRRLTPIECERLQGFPDDWTAGVSDTQRYKQMGNAVTTNVIEAVARRLPLEA